LAAPLRLHETSVPPAWIDYNGHAHESAYLRLTGDATDALLNLVGVDAAYRREAGSYFTVEKIQERWRRGWDVAYWRQPLELTCNEFTASGFLIERSTVDRPEFPNAISIIGATGVDGGLQQHYFDSRGVARVYEMTFEGGVWTLFREGPDWPQRYVGELSEDGNTITGRWERGTELGAPLEHDFDLTYTRVR